MLAARLAEAADLTKPWPHSIFDEALPGDVFADLLGALPDWKTTNKTKKLPASVLAMLTAPEVERAIRERWGFSGGKPTIELTFRTRRIEAHCDRDDKLWSGILYIAGDPVGTELYAGPELVKTVEFRPNRLLCWGHQGEMHAVPKSNGRSAIQWWYLR